MTLQQAYQTAFGRSSARTEDRAFDLSCLFEHAFGISRYRLALIGGQPAGETETAGFFALCARYEAGEPLQYLLGEWEFYGLPFFVGEGVLIPRPDTETLVEVALSLIKDVQNPVVADLCAGSGCIAVAIAKMRPDAQVYALELSEAALPYLTANAERNHARVTVMQCDVLTPPELPPLDLAVSNPPYISRRDMEQLQLQVRHEPEMALRGGEDGCDFYRALPEIYLSRLKKGGAIAFEVGYDQAEITAELLSDAGYCAVKIEKDLAGIARVVRARTQR